MKKNEKVTPIKRKSPEKPSDNRFVEVSYKTTKKPKDSGMSQTNARRTLRGTRIV